MGTSWIDFYNQLTANSKVATQQRSANFASPSLFRLDYGASRMGGGGSVKKQGSKKRTQLDALGPLKYLTGGLGLLDDIVAKGDDPRTAGARLLDVLSRGTYASAGYTSAMQERRKNKTGVEKLQVGLEDMLSPEVLKGIWEGLSGQNKLTYSDVNKKDGMDKGILRGALSFAEDVAFDPTTYIGAGAIKAGLGAAKKIGKVNKAQEFVKEIAPGVGAIRQPEAVKQLTSLAPTVKTPDKDFAKFIENVTRNAQNPGEPAIFDNIIDQTGKPVRGAIPSFERQFIGGMGGDIGERFMLPGPTPDVISGRVRMTEADKLAQQVPQFQYGQWIDQAPVTGPYKESVSRVPVPKENAAGLTPEGQLEVDLAREIAKDNPAVIAKRQLQQKYSGLAQAGDPDLKNVRPEVKVIMSQVDEPVFARYEPKTIETTTEAGRKQTIKVWQPNPEDVADGNFMHMGEIRTRLLNPATSKTERARLLGMLGNHIRAVEDWIKSNPAGYKDAAGQTALYRELYGRAPKDIGKAAKTRVETDLGLPPSPFENTPTFMEVREWKKMDWADKLVFMEMNFKGLSPEHMTYLSQANTQKSFATRLKKLQNLVREGGTTNAADLVDAIRAGRVQAVDEAGIPELLAHYNVKTLKQLANAIEKDQKSLSAAEKKMLGKIIPNEEGLVPAEARMGVEVKDAQLKELGPTGLPYAPYETRLKKQVAAAKKKAERVVPAERIIQGVMEGDKRALAVPKVAFSGSQRQMFDQALAMAVDKNIIQPKDVELWKYVTRTGVKRTKKTPGKGLGRVQDAWNVYSQYDFFKGLLADADKVDAGVKQALDQLNVRGPDRLAARADYMYGLLMDPMRAMDETLKQGGIFPVAGTRQYDTPFSFYDAFASLPDSFVKKNIFTLQRSKAYGYGSRIAPTQLMEVLDMGVSAMRTKGVSDELEGLIKAALLEVKVTNSGRKIPNYMPHLAKTRPEELDQIVSDIIDSLPELAQKVEKNSAQRKLWHENQQFEGTQAALDAIAQRVASPDYNIPESLKLANEVDPTIKAVTRSKGIDESDEFMVRASVNAAAPDLGLTAQVRAEAKRAHLRNTKKTKVERTKAGVDEMAEAEAEVAKVEDGLPLNDFANQVDNTMINKFITSFFPHWNNETLRPMYLNHSSATQTVARTFQGALAKASQRHASKDIQTAWKELQIGRWSADPAIKAAQTDLNKIIGTMFSDDAAMSLFNRRGLTASELNAHFDHFKIHPKYHFDSDEAMHNAWRTWDTNDPLQLMSQMFAATMQTTGKKLLGDQLMQKFGSFTPQPGYVKLKNKGNEILRYIDTENVYFPREIAREMHILDKFLKIAMAPTYSGVGSDALKLYDSALHAYKSGLTIYRPGHHVRNMVGDVWLSFMAGVNDPTVYNDALRVMRQMRGRYDDFDAIKALAAGDKYVPDDASTSIIKYVTIGGKRRGLTASDIYRNLYDRGILPDYRTLEDVQFGQESATSKFRPFGGKVHQVAATVSESRDHYIRIAHAVDVLKKGKFKTLDDAFDAAAHEVRKWHPDGSDLTHFEKKVMRRTFLFYSWIRKAIPLVLEGMVMRPGRALVYPKAIYNMAEAQGIDLASLGNPFPDDQLFPSWLSEGLQGPLTQNDQGEYWGASPGVPMMDILGDYAGNNPMATILGSVSPVAKIPMEVAYGENAGAVARDVRTDVPYYDLSDYVDKQLPNANLLTGMTGMSPSSLFTQQKGGEDRERQTDAARTLANFLSGLGLINMSKPGYIQQAKREQGMRNGR